MSELNDIIVPLSLTQAEIDAITSPDPGSIVFNSTIGKNQSYEGGQWVDTTPTTGLSQIQEYAEVYFATVNATPTVIVSPNTPVKVEGATTLGFSSSNVGIGGQSNRIQWNGPAPITVEVIATLSLDKVGGGGDENFTCYLSQTGSILVRSKSSVRVDGSDRTTATPKCIAVVAPGQYFEVWLENLADGDDVVVRDMHISFKQILT